MKSTPHFVLFSRTGEHTSDEDLHGGSWYFRLESSIGQRRLEASDVEADASRERLELLAVVRGLEALDQPSAVTLITTSRQVSRAVRQGLEYWRIRDWKWERFGEKVPMKNGDLWKRIDCALKIHDVRCRTFRLDTQHGPQEMHSHQRNPVDNGRDRNLAARVDVRHGANESQRRRSHIAKPFVWATRRVANAMLATANGLQRCLPESASPHPT